MMVQWLPSYCKDLAKKSHDGTVVAIKLQDLTKKKHDGTVVTITLQDLTKQKTMVVQYLP